MARLSAFSRQLEVMVDQTLSPQARSAMIAQAARGALAEAQAQNRAVLGVVPEHETFVDGSQGRDLDAVDPDRGVIVFAFNVQFDMFDFIGRLLLDHAPVLTGEFQSSIKLFADGVEVAGFDPKNLAEEWVFVSAVPYARKIEKGSSDQAPDGVFEAVAAIASQRYGNVARIRFTFREVAGSGVGRNPAIVVTLR